jgi:hypothetical protein
MPRRPHARESARNLQVREGGNRFLFVLGVKEHIRSLGADGRRTLSSESVGNNSCSNPPVPKRAAEVPD